MKIGLDIMGGDNAPSAPIAAATKYAQEFNQHHIYLYGSKEALDLVDDKIENIIKVVTTEVIEVCDDPALSIRRKKDSSLVVGSRALANKEIDAFISAGSTGAIVSAGFFIVKRIKGIERPALPGIFPINNGTKKAIILDVGANSETKPVHMLDQAKLASIYMKEIYGVTSPNVKLLNIGEEASKGTELYKQTYELLENEQTINFTGNIEPRYIFNTEADVIVVDGFTGNMVLKTLEGTSKLYSTSLREIFSSSILTKLSYLSIKSKMDKFKKNLDYKEIGGTPLFGVNEILIKAHGSSNDKALYNALKQGVVMYEQDYINKIKKEI